MAINHPKAAELKTVLEAAKQNLAIASSAHKSAKEQFERFCNVYNLIEKLWTYEVVGGTLLVKGEVPCIRCTIPGQASMAEMWLNSQGHNAPRGTRFHPWITLLRESLAMRGCTRILWRIQPLREEYVAEYGAKLVFVDMTTARMCDLQDSGTHYPMIPGLLEYEIIGQAPPTASDQSAS